MATKVKDGVYKTVVYLGKDAAGKRKQKVFYGKSADEADFFALQFKLKKQREEDPVQITLATAIDKYIESKDAVLSPTTIEGYRKIKNNHFHGLMDMKLADIDSKVLQQAVNMEAKMISRRGKPLSAKTIANANGLIVSVINYYFPEKRIIVRLPQRKPITYETPDGEQLQAIFAVTKGTSIEIPVLLAAWLSLSMSEVCGLKWSNIHDEYIEINESKVYANRKQHSKAPKTTARARKIPLPDYIKDKLAQQPHDGEYVTHMTGQAIYKKFVTLLEENGLPHCRFHDLRHASASIMLQLGVPDKYAMRRGGWSSDRIMKQVYQQTFSSEEIRVADQIDSYFDQLIHT